MNMQTEIITDLLKNGNEITTEKVKEVCQSTVQTMVNEWADANTQYETELSCFEYVFKTSKRHGLDMVELSKALYGEDKPQKVWEFVKEMVLGSQILDKPFTVRQFIEKATDSSNHVTREMYVDFNEL